MGQERNKKGNKASVTTGALDQTAPGEVSVWVLCWRALLSSLALDVPDPNPTNPRDPRADSLHIQQSPHHICNHWSLGTDCPWRAAVTTSLGRNIPWRQPWPGLYLEEPQNHISVHYRHGPACTQGKSGHLSHRPPLHQLEEEGSPGAQAPPAPAGWAEGSVSTHSTT